MTMMPLTSAKEPAAGHTGSPSMSARQALLGVADTEIGSGPGSPRGQPAWGGGSDRVKHSSRSFGVRIITKSSLGSGRYAPGSVTQSLTAIPIALTPFQGQRPSIRFSTGINVSMILS